MKKFLLSLFRLIICGTGIIGLSFSAPLVGRNSLSIPPTSEPPDCLSDLTIRVTSNPSTIEYGQSSVVSWSVNLPANCVQFSVRFNGRVVAKSGSQTVTPARSTRYKVTVFFAKFPTPEEAFTDVTVEGFCPPTSHPNIIEIREAHPKVDKKLHDRMRQCLIEAVKVPNTTILLGPDVELDFSDASVNDIPLSFGPGVTLTSTNTFGPDSANPHLGGLVTEGNSPDTVLSTPTSPQSLTPQLDVVPPSNQGEIAIWGTQGPARTPQSSGPLLKFGPHRKENMVFLLINCPPDDPNNPYDDVVPSDNVRISGFRIHGPSFGDQSVDDIGIQIRRCLNIEISNMEIAGWGGQAIQVLDEGNAENQPADGPGQEQPNNFPGERIGRPEQVRIFHNYIHHNQHAREGMWPFGGEAAGYGVQVHHGAWAQIYENVFDFNRHAIEASGDAGGYEAFRNLVLKGGGYHYAGFHTHQFDIHGSEDSLLGGSGKGGQAGVQFWYYQNSFQYLVDNAIYVRGTPKESVTIRDNVFAHDSIDAAIKVYDYRDILKGIISRGPNNVIDYDSYGRYDVCDFDGDGIDDLFLATGNTWWFSSYGEFPWTYLSARTERLDQVRLGYFDDDLRCDVLTESGSEWVISSGGTGEWYSIGEFEAPLGEVAFGQFDSKGPNPTISGTSGVPSRTTHAFWRTQNCDTSCEWLVTPLSGPDWQLVGSSSFPISDLRFGDFTGDGVTDVLAVENGRWAISESARESWRELNPDLSDDVSSLYIADINNNNIDDLIKLEWMKKETFGNIVVETFTWWVSHDGRSEWRKLTAYNFTHFKNASLLPIFAFAGRFGAAPGEGVLLIDHDRKGHFFSEAETGVLTDWTSLFLY